MSATEKILWVVNYRTLDEFLQKAVDVGATGVAIRTDNNLAKAIPAFHDKNIKVFGWRWPSAMHDPCMVEADRVVNLLANGLDGYFVDPEGAPGKPFDWDKKGLDELADEFCTAIMSAAPDKPFGVTSHYHGVKTFPNLPWATFFEHASVLLPQSYWRSSEGTIGHGIPEDNYRVGLDLWTQSGGDKAKIVPMAGELASVTADEIGKHVAEATAQRIDVLHFYTHEPAVKPSVWDAVAAA